MPRNKKVFHVRKQNKNDVQSKEAFSSILDRKYVNSGCEKLGRQKEIFILNLNYKSGMSIIFLVLNICGVFMLF